MEINYMKLSLGVLSSNLRCFDSEQGGEEEEKVNYQMMNYVCTCKGIKRKRWK